MTRIALVVSDVDGTLLTKDKILTDAAREAVQRIHQAGIGFTITSSRPAVGMRFLIEPLNITLPVGPFNGSSIIDPEMKVVELHALPRSAASRTIDILDEFEVDIWLFTNEKWFTRNGNGAYVAHESSTIRAEPTVVSDFSPHLADACKIVGSSADAERLIRCEAAMRKALGGEATAVRSQSYYLDVTPPGHNKGTFVKTIARQLSVPADSVATIGDMQNDLAMFEVSGTSFAMGNASADVRKRATHVTASNEDDGFAKAMDAILRGNSAE